MKNTRHLFAFASTFILLISGCQKGDSGDVGPAGTQGVSGSNGAHGNNNVHAETFTVMPYEWIQFGTEGSAGCSKYIEYPVALITQDIFDHGSIQTSFKIDSAWVNIPFLLTNSPSLYIQSSYKVNFVRIELTQTDEYFPAIGTPMDFKIITMSE